MSGDERPDGHEARTGMCPGTSRTGKPCGHRAGYGTDHVGYGYCKHHTGSTPSGRKHAQREVAREAVRVLGLPRDVDPQEALAEELARTAGQIDWLYQEQLSTLDGLTQPQYVRTDKDGGTTEGPLVPSVFLELYEQNRRHYAQVARFAAAAGVEHRRVELEEAQVMLFAHAMRALADRLQLTPEQRAAFPTIAREVLEQLPAVTADAS